MIQKSKVKRQRSSLASCGRAGFALPNFSRKNSEGFITLVATLVVGAVGLSIALSLLLLGLGSSRTSLTTQQSTQARTLANACAEEALQKIRENSAFTGSGGLSIGAGTCSYSVTSGAGQARHIDASGTVGAIVRKLDIDITAIKPKIIISLWQEVP